MLDNTGPAVDKPFQGHMPTKDGRLDFITADLEDIDSYNDYVTRRNDAAELLQRQFDDVEGVQQQERDHNAGLKSGEQAVQRAEPRKPSDTYRNR